MTGFARTLRTASEACGIAALLDRSAAVARGPDRWALERLAERYRDYAAALRETAHEPEPEVNDEQQELL